jgi:hypothetical protein
METFGFAGFAVGFMAVVWWLTRLMSATTRNGEMSHNRDAGF